MTRRRVLPSVTGRIMGVPWHNARYPRLFFGGYKTQKGKRPAEQHAILHTEGFENITPDDVVLIRINSACFTSDVFGDTVCDCNAQLVAALQMIQNSPDRGAILYHLAHEGKAHGWTEKLMAYHEEMFSVNGDRRDFTSAVAILKDMGVRRVRLITNNPEKMEILAQYGIELVGTVPVISEDPNHAKLLHFKRTALGHHIPDFGMPDLAVHIPDELLPTGTE